VTLLADKDERFKNLFGKAALFILLAVLGLAAMMLWMGIQKGAFSAKSSIFFIADSGQSLSEGMPVKYSGFKIGKLHTLTLNEQGRVQVELLIETKYLKLIRQDSVINLMKEGLIGDGMLEFSRGTEDKPALIDHSVVSFERSNGLEQAAVDVKNRVMPILDDVHQILHDLQGDLRQTLKNLRELSSTLNTTSSSAEQVLNNVDANLNNEVGPLLRSLRQSASNAETISTKINHDLPSLLKKADDSLENFRQTSQLLKDALQTSAPQLPEIIGEAREVAGDTREMLDSMSKHWPFNNAAPVTETQLINMDSHD